jgi:hypothetical protein
MTASDILGGRVWMGKTVFGVFGFILQVNFVRLCETGFASAALRSFLLVISAASTQ